jgi:hypothetical protein
MRRTALAALSFALAACPGAGDEVAIDAPDPPDARIPADALPIDGIPIDATDAGAPYTYTAFVEMPAGGFGALTPRIDGVVGQQYTRVFWSLQEVRDAEIRFELLDGEDVVESRTFSPFYPLQFCGDAWDDEPADLGQFVCAMRHGEVRLRDSNLLTEHGQHCHGGSGCALSCGIGSCPAGKCSTSFSSAALAWSHVDCVPIGARLTGESCAWTAGTDGRFVDDCAADNLCVDGTCRARCTSAATCAGGDTCAAPPGHAPEMRVCLPPA